jgi:adenosyl cobinamide kinase/adenosyl cobinamide phosphate guanylyltransferase
MKTIDDHRQRRGKDWATFEVGSALDQDIDEIKVWISAAQGLEACLLDGMITWFIHLKEAGHPATADHFAQRIVEVVSVRDLVWRLVDVDPEIFKAISPEWELYREILDYIITTLKITKIKNWNYE